LLRRLKTPSPALVIALIALFVSLGGVSYGLATGSIDSREIKNNTVRSKDIRNSQVLSRDIRNSTVRGRDVGLNTLGGLDIDESKLGRVPTASRADSVGGLRVLPRVVAAPGQVRPVATQGPLTLQLRCTSLGGGDVRFSLEVDSSADNAASDATGGDDIDDLDASDSPAAVASGNGIGQTMEHASWSALTPSGGRFQGYGLAASKVGGANVCFADVVLIG
jgi:hypothetical protein